jgi:BASS family bile acid:Na+ symporter
MIERLINILVTITLIEMMIAIGLSVSLTEIQMVARNWRMVARAALANYVCVPAIAVALIFMYGPHPMVAAGFLVLAVCPGAPFGPSFTALAKGNVAVAVALMAILAGSSAIVAPILLYYLLPLVSEGEPLTIDLARLVATLVLFQLAPLCVGLAVRYYNPTLASHLQKRADRLSAVLGVSAVGGILLAQYQLLAEIHLRGFSAMIFFLAASLVAGWLLGGSDRETRIAITLTTSLRNIGVGLVIVIGSFADTPAVTAAIVYGLVEIFGSLLVAIAWSRRKTVSNLSQLS